MWRVIDFILNVAGVLLWLNWRSIRFDPFHRAVPSTLAGTLRRAEPSRLKRWHFLAALGGLLLIRAAFYREVGPALDLVPTLDFGFVALAFRGDRFGPVLVFSFLSFAMMLVIFYSWLIFLAVVNRRDQEGDPFQKMIQLLLGRITRWPLFVQLLLPLIAAVVSWIALHPLLVWVGVINQAGSIVPLLEQGLLVGLTVVFSLKYLLPPLLFVHLMATYVYLGRNPLWDFVGVTARNVLRPLPRLPLRVGRMDFAPLVGIALALLALHFAPEWIRTGMMKRGWTVWPQ